MEIRSQIINDKNIFAFTSKNEFLDYINNESKILIALNAEKLIRSDKNLDEIINSNIGYADGIGAVWALKRKGLKAIKIAGAEFWLDIISRYYKTKSFYLIGASQEVIGNAVTKLKAEFPKIRIVGYRNGFFTDRDKEELIQDLKSKKPEFVFVAMGSPKQEFLMADFQQHHPALYMGLGGSFDVYSGQKKRAPLIFQKYGLEWFYRLLKEPTRIPRQFNLAKFFLRIAFNKL